LDNLSCSSNDRCRNRSSLNRLGGLFSRCLSGSGRLRSRVLQWSDGSRFVNLGRVLINFGGGCNLGFGLGLEEVTNTSGQTTANLGSLGLLLLFLLLFFLFLLLFLLGLLSSDGLSNKGSRGNLSLLDRFRRLLLRSLSSRSLSGRLLLGGSFLCSGRSGLGFFLLLLFLRALWGLHLLLSLGLGILERSEQFGKQAGALGPLLLFSLRLSRFAFFLGRLLSCSGSSLGLSSGDGGLGFGGSRSSGLSGGNDSLFNLGLGGRGSLYRLLLNGGNDGGSSDFRGRHYCRTRRERERELDIERENACNARVERN